MPQKQLILENLHELLAHNVIGDLQYDNRYKGFNGELSFINWYSSRRPDDRLFDGGYFLPTIKNVNSYHVSSIYFTVSSNEPNDYLDIYQQIANIHLKGYFFIQYSAEIPFEQWEQLDLLRTGRPLPVPRFKVFEYFPQHGLFGESSLEKFVSNYEVLAGYKPKNNVPAQMKERWIAKLEDHEEKYLLQLYIQRLVFDGLLGFKVIKGIPSDIDCIVRTVQNIMLIFEIKEKDVSKGQIKGFGMDIDRIRALKKLDDITKIPVYYIVRRVDNQTDRKFMEWRVISILNFIRYIDRLPINGGTGMRTVFSVNPTLVCGLKYFAVRK